MVGTNRREFLAVMGATAAGAALGGHAGLPGGPGDASARERPSGFRPRADVILHSGKILTVDARFSIAQAVAIEDDRIIAVGTNHDAFRFTGPGTRRIDLGGRTVTPGFIDGHAHMDREGLRYIYPSLAGARSRDDILGIIRQLVARAQPGDWIVTMPLGDPPFHFDARQILQDTGLNRWVLDTVSPRNPVYIRSIWGFWDRPPLVSVANSEALRVAGVSRETEAPHPQIQIERDASGEPTGVFRESASQPALEHTLFKMVPRFTHEDRVAGLRTSMRIYNAAGTTSVYEGHGIASEVARAYRELWAEGALTLRSALVISPTPGWFEKSVPTRPELEEMFRDWAMYASGAGFGDGMLRTTGVFLQSGGDARLARVLAAEAPYTAWAAYYYDAAPVPPATLPAEVFRTGAMLAARYGLRGHTTGLGSALDVFEEVDRTYPIRDKRWVIEHVSVVSPADAQRMARLGIVPTAIPASSVWKATPPTNLTNFGAYKNVLNAGLKLSLCTDNVPAQPFFTIWVTVTRMNRLAGTPLDGTPPQKLSREEALRAATLNGAYLTFEEDVKGSIEVGKYADLIVIDRDYLTVDEDAIKDIKVLMTMVGGKVVYEA